MSGSSPEAVLYDRDGSVLPVDNGVPYPSDTPTLIMGGSDGTNARYILVDSSGRQIMVGAGVAGTPAGGVISIQGVAGGTVVPISITGTNTISGTVTANQGTAAALSGYWPVRITDGTNTMPTGDAVGRAIFYKLTDGTNTAAVTASSALKVDGSGATQPVSGTVTANQGTSPWVTNITQFGSSNIVTGTGAGGAGIPRVTVSNDSNILATQSGTWTVTATQATAANLRSQTASESTTATSTGTVAALIGGAVTTAAPTYTTGQMDPLSLTTAGALRIDGSGVTQPVSGTVTANQGTANTLANGWPVKVTDGTNTMPTGDTVGRAIFQKITDGTNTAAVKAASTVPVAADSALVVATSPNSPDVNDTVGSAGTLNALNATATVVLAGQTSVGMQLAAGTLIGTIVPEISMDGGTTWVASFFDDPATDNKAASIVFSSSNTATTRTIVGAGGASNARVRVSAFTSGTASCTLRATDVKDPSALYSGAAGATTQPPSGVQIAGWDSATTTFRVPAVKAASTSPVATDQALVVVLSPNQTSIPVTDAPSSAVPAIAAGYVTHASTAKTAVIASTYNEQTTNAQRSFKSASANDTSAGTGARTILLTYYDQTLAGPFTETITMNGTSAVNTVSSTICYVESIVVATAGSGTVNAGIISMFTTTGGGGSTMATVNAGENRTFWGNHYVATGKICYITGLSGHNTNTSNGSVLTLTAFNPSSANQVESQISDFVRCGGGTSQPVRVYNQLIKVVGPNRVRLYEACEGTPTITTRAAFDFYDQ